jgi:cytochrome c oxidase cbb3-type subunit III
MTPSHPAPTPWHFLLATVLVLVGTASGVMAANITESVSGQALYNFYCYQCHGYNGDAATLASTYLEPKPRDFTRADGKILTRDRMRQAIQQGRPGTAMVSFARVLNAAQTDAVVEYVQKTFMRGAAPTGRYHTAANGWPDHERYATAFPFADGTIALDTPWEALTAGQREGKRLFLSSCISCHDRARVQNPGPVWEPHAFSYPRVGTILTPRVAVDAVSNATPYYRHDVPPPDAGLTPAETRGRELFLQNCAFCHAADGTGRNWIGSFLEPRPRDLTARTIVTKKPQDLRRVIERGLPGTSMPAWREVLSAGQISDLIAWLQRTHALPLAPHPVQPPSADAAKTPVWQAAPVRR